ncbi:hypothetical protein CSOJ01_10296 [Colletotrichum sojae]|uniref:Uncharacterized protein n=1 Tax=Colletotrichum sojae TaxID=2175907 RepID=A0A8H6J0Q7_9PEZI|nr:hypothetical protein CSOJ01_10296 [Colletotrichum sojae]
MSGGRQISIHPNLEEADRMRKVLEWVVVHYGSGFQETPVRVFRGSAEDALKEVAKVETPGIFGKLALGLLWAATE